VVISGLSVGTRMARSYRRAASYLAIYFTGMKHISHSKLSLSEFLGQPLAILAARLFTLSSVICVEGQQLANHVTNQVTSICDHRPYPL